MHPRNGFISVEEAASDGQNGQHDTSWKVTGADVCALAFISDEDLPPCGLTELDPALTDAVASLRAEGAAPPPISFSGPQDFIATLRKRDHRGALALAEPTAWLDRDERIVRVSFRYTSGRVGAGFVRRPTGVRFNAGGATDKRRCAVTFAETYARIDCWQRFALGFAGDLNGRFPGAEVTPLGWLMITYILHADGRSRAWCASSYLPSVWFYRDYVRAHRRPMSRATAPEAEAVLVPKPDAPTGTRWVSLDTSTDCVNAVAS